MSAWRRRSEPNRRVPAWKRDMPYRKRRWLRDHREVYRPSALGLLLAWLRGLARGWSHSSRGGGRREY